MEEKESTGQLDMTRAPSAPVSDSNSSSRTEGEVDQQRGDAYVDVENGYRAPNDYLVTRRATSSTTAAHEQQRQQEQQYARPRGPERYHSHMEPLYEDQGPQYNSESLARIISAARHSIGTRGKIGIRDRICCFQWTWFTMTMATGGIANVLFSVNQAYPAAKWVWYIGLVFFLLNVALFLMNCILITMRFVMVPGSFMHSFMDQLESLFIPSVVVSIGTILINITQYGIPNTGPWLQHLMGALFWVYLAISVSASAGMYLILWSTQVFPIQTMTPVWVFPAYPLLLTAPFASNLVQADRTVHPGSDIQIDRLSIAITAVTVQGTGFLISFMICAAFLYRLMTQKLPRDMQRPGVFISIGPPAFTVAGLVLLGQQAKDVLPSDYTGQNHAVFILEIISLLIGLWLWGLSEWFFLVSVGSLWKYTRHNHKMPFQMTWWSFVFPNTALVTATLALAKALDTSGMRVYGCVMAAALVVVWLLVAGNMIRCLWNRHLLWPVDLEKERMG
ncbi:voltage-dependent anion channel-domain-containing protein [Poronia punctata]|nr:voltage-dependent anion channel-domain-containing protein [Poronia punctata]